MGYRIEYGEKGSAKIKRISSGRPWRLTMVFLFAFLLGVKCFWEEGSHFLSQILLRALTGAEPDAIEVLLTNLEQGNSVSESLRLFCRGLLEHAGLY